MQVLKSRKLRVLQAAYGRPWWEIAVEAVDTGLTQAQIGAAWTEAVRGTRPGVTFTQQDVCKTVRRALEVYLRMNPERVRHLLDQPLSVDRSEGLVVV